MVLTKVAMGTAVILLIAMAAVDSFSLLYKEIGRTCSCYTEVLAVIGACYTAKKCIVCAWDCYSLIRLHFIPKLVRKADLIKQYGRWAVVTGATAGIGKAYAEQLANHGVNVILISRNKEKLQAVAKDIAETYKVKTDFIVADFSKGREIYSAIKEDLRDKEIGILVNNVGVCYNYPDYFIRVSEDKLWEMININIGAVNMMTHMVLPGMVERKKGAIVNISSASCCQPVPQLTAYAASKAYVDYFSRALYYEYAPKGIFVQSLIPMVTSTNMTQFSRLLSSKSFIIPTAEVYARHAISTLGISRRTTGYWGHFVQGCLLSLPEWLYAWLSNNISWFLRQDALSHRLD
ncbi:PREDICTED: inactive hydroxysteroid dehydrogenase-like protein 1 isoform X4 [Gavialis gangeticus]|uniref:inactive hydroxysteroid dehydrogenase-like protein 1 isoform X1 n=2 Tax=Gavialis gangeticus TaxID=94835 RepID=UPI00092E8125|nr:PREDICTED: inactive hydroxysteroid dehydrogenase-like protein 1 isoform X1 [Gavialis gangeticus]XP_019361315.1 PREDICTED: inactive hydroxysteroid dehydrogenase-like protein 1 isoform X4 [Gavialis gangeticus]